MGGTVVEAGTGWHGDNYRVMVYGRHGPYAQQGWAIASTHATLAEAQAAQGGHGCYSDHAEDVRTKGACDLLRGGWPDRGWTL